MSIKSTFETFCAAHALQQKQNGLDVPSRQSHSFSYYQWLDAARQIFHDTHAEELECKDEQPSKKVKAEGDAAQTRASALDADNVLAVVLAQQLTSSLERQADLSTAPASLRYATEEAFPTPSAAAGMPAFLTLAEAAMRLTLWHPKDARLAQLAARMRPNLRCLEEKGIIRTQEGCFPELQLLMDLLSWRIIAHRWACLTPEMRRVAVDGVQTLCTCVSSPATDELHMAIQQLDVSVNEMLVPITQLDSLVGQVSAAIPFHFDACRDLATLYPEPTGTLRVPGLPQPENAPSAPNLLDNTTEPATSSGSGTPLVDSEEEDSEICVGDLLGAEASASAVATTTPPSNEAAARPIAQPPLSTSNRTSPHVAHPVLEVVPYASSRQSASTNNNSTLGTGLLPAHTINGHRACASQYHQRYADASKHASPECQYCATCHLMEIIFRGERRDCTWRHWPTRRKIQFHLKRFPNVLQSALMRFSEMERGVQLEATDIVPL